MRVTHLFSGPGKEHVAVLRLYNTPPCRVCQGQVYLRRGTLYLTAQIFIVLQEQRQEMVWEKHAEGITLYP